MSPVAAFVTLYPSEGELLNFVMPVQRDQYSELRNVHNAVELASWLNEHLLDNPAYEDIHERVRSVAPDTRIDLSLEHIGDT
jgi:hypothetical protein